MELQLDNVTAGWCPDLSYLYSDRLKDFHLDDNRYMQYEKRFMLTTNKIEPKVYRVTKVLEIAPKGVIKYTFKQDEYDEAADNPDLLICNYYNDSGEIQIEEPDPVIDPSKTSVIYYMEIQPDGSEVRRLGPVTIHKSDLVNFEAETSATDDIYLEWRTKLIYSPTEDVSKLTDEKLNYYCNLLKIRKYSNTQLSLYVGTANSLIGKKFELYIEDQNGNYHSSIELEVGE